MRPLPKHPENPKFMYQNEERLELRNKKKERNNVTNLDGQVITYHH